MLGIARVEMTAKKRPPGSQKVCRMSIGWALGRTERACCWGGIAAADALLLDVPLVHLLCVRRLEVYAFG
eukprot:365208-Chlamydomonas_euryale.AAC.2